MKVFAQLSIAALASYAAATSIDVSKRETPLHVELTATGNSEVKVVVTNGGAKTVNLLSKGTFLDEALPVEKVTIFSAGGSKQVPFEGIKVQLLTTGLSTDDFVTLGAGESKDFTVETAALHTLSSGGDFDVFAKGLLPFAEEGSTELAGSLNYESNKLTMSVDGAIAATVSKVAKRTTINSSCTGTKLTTVRTALSNCVRLATAASSAASAGTKLQEYFKSTSASTKSTVSARLTAVASDCSGGSKTTTACNDPYGGCGSNVLAYTVPSANFIAYCPLFFSALPALSSTCHGQDQATTVIHEETHAPAVYSPGTQDLGYGYAAATSLSASQALNNADSYALYSNAIYLNC